MVALADNDMEVGLAFGTGLSDASFEDGFGLFDVLPVQVDAGVGYTTGSIVLTEDKLGGLTVVVGLFALVGLAWKRGGDVSWGFG